MTEVLLIEDNAGIAEVTMDLLVLKGMSVTHVGTADDALKYLVRSIPDVIICDVMLPDGSGLDILKFLRETDILFNVPFIFASGLADVSDVRKGMALGADDYLTKPFDIADLLASINACLLKVNQRKDQFQKLEQERDDSVRKIESVKQITSHELRSRVVRINNLIKLAKGGHMDKNKVFEWMLESGEYLDEVIHKVHDVLSTVEHLNVEQKPLKEVPKIVWHIDDDPVQRTYTAFTVVRAVPNIDFHSFSGPDEALRILDKGVKPDVILLDIQMPIKSGYDFLDELKQKQLKLEVVMLSSSISDTDVKRSFSYPNVVGYETKPISQDVLKLMFGLVS